MTDDHAGSTDIHGSTPTTMMPHNAGNEMQHSATSADHHGG